MRKDQIDAMVDRFLQWKLPQDFHPDNHISFDPKPFANPPHSNHWPVGTNLFTAEQARAMVEHMLAAPKKEG